MTPPRPKTREVAEELARALVRSFDFDQRLVLLSEADIQKVADALLAAHARGKTEGRAEALEEAVKAVCVGCRKGYPVETSLHFDDLKVHITPDRRRVGCDAQAIRALATKEHA